jgi:hypothetical protein
MKPEPYNPLAKVNLGKSVAEALLDGSPHPLAELPRFQGAGIYVLYYTGGFLPYAPMADINRVNLVWPIYIGKAVPSGARRGVSLFETSETAALFSRLREHKNSIAEVERAGGGLSVADFQARYLAVDDIWIPLGEALLIKRFRPLWNAYLDGFGNHAPGAGRHQGEMPRWDTLHGGRAGFQKLRPNSMSVDAVLEGVTLFLRENPPPKDGHMDFSPPGEGSG